MAFSIISTGICEKLPSLRLYRRRGQDIRIVIVAIPSLHAKFMVVYDDTSLLAGKWQGKGMLGVPWMLERGWKPVFVGHQTVLAAT